MKPMLASPLEGTPNFPVLASPKLDGIRALVLNGELVSRNLKPIRNKLLQAQLSKPEFEGLDGELILGPHDGEVFRRTTSAVSSFDGASGVEFWVFDRFTEPGGFVHRYESLLREWPHFIKVVPHQWLNSMQALQEYEAKCLESGFEGVMLRDPTGHYKHGRSTAKEGLLLKVKQFEDAEAVVLGLEERMHNGNAAKVNALGHTERSSHQANMVGRGDLGALRVRGINGPYTDVEFNIGSGFDDAERHRLWQMGTSLCGAVVKYRYFPTGSKDAPRFPTFLGFRQDL